MMQTHKTANLEEKTIPINCWIFALEGSLFYCMPQFVVRKFILEWSKKSSKKNNSEQVNINTVKTVSISMFLPLFQDFHTLMTFSGA